MKSHILSLFLAVLLAITTGAAQWLRTGLPAGPPVVALAANGGTLFVGLDQGGGVARTTDAGASWNAVNNGLKGSTLRALTASAGNIFAGDYGEGVFRSTDNGENWTAVNNGVDLGIRVLVTSDSHLYAGLTASGVFVSTDNGINWIHANVGMDYGGSVRSLAVADTVVLAVTLGGVFCSTNNGENWMRLNNGLTNTLVYATGITGAAFLAGTSGGGIFRSTDNGSVWTPVSSGLTDTANMAVLTFAFHDTRIFAGTTKGIFLSDNGGLSWTSANSGLTTQRVNALFVFGSSMFAGTENGGVWVRPLTEFVTTVEPGEGDGVGGFRIERNYPNPFNPRTTIKYELPKSSEVRLSVYDVLGREVEVLVNEIRDAGVHEVKFDGSGLSSGLYFYRLQAGDFVATSRLLFLK